MNTKNDTKIDLVIKNGSVIFPNYKTEKADIGISEGKICEIGSVDRSQANQVVDAKGLIVMPGAIDTQVHFREPGLTHKEDIHNGTKGAILGGITTVFEMPNTSPATINKEQLDIKLEIARKQAFCNYSFFIGAAKENIEDLSNLERLAGCCGVKIFMGASTGDLLVEDDDSLRKIISNIDRKFAVHSEDEYRLRDRKKILDDPNISVNSHPVWRDDESAIKSTQRLLKIAREVGKTNLHILHISTADEIKMIEKNKDICSCEVTPQHLYFSSPDCYDLLGTNAQMNPPIRNENHQKGLWYGIKNKVVDVIGSDHAPHTIEEKEKKYPLSPSGMTGVQTLLPIMLNFVNENKLKIEDVVRLISVNPCKIYKIKNKGKISLGYDADLTIIDLEKEFEITNKWIASKSGWTPYNDLRIKGMPIYTIVNGKIAMRENEINENLYGKCVEFNL